MPRIPTKIFQLVNRRVLQRSTVAADGFKNHRVSTQSKLLSPRVLQLEPVKIEWQKVNLLKSETNEQDQLSEEIACAALNQFNIVKLSLKLSTFLQKVPLTERGLRLSRIILKGDLIISKLDFQTRQKAQEKLWTQIYPVFLQHLALIPGLQDASFILQRPTDNFSSCRLLINEFKSADLRLSDLVAPLDPTQEFMDLMHTLSTEYPMTEPKPLKKCKCCCFDLKKEPKPVQNFLSTQSDLMISLLESKNTNQALEVLRLLLQRNMTPLGTATHMLFEHLNNRPKCAISVFFAIENVEKRMNLDHKLARHRYFLFNSCLSAFCKLETIDLAKSLFCLMLQETNQVPDMRTLSKLYDVLSKQKDVGFMVFVLKTLFLNKMLFPLQFNQLIAQLIQNNLYLAYELLQIMKKINVCPNAVTYSTLIKGCLDKNMEEMADKLFEEMIQHPKAKTEQFMNSMGPFHALMKHYSVKNSKKTKNVFSIFQKNFSELISPTKYTFLILNK